MTYFKRNGFSIREGCAGPNITMLWGPPYRLFIYVHLWGNVRWYRGWLRAGEAEKIRKQVNDQT